MCDFLGRELKIGDKVVYLMYCRTSSMYVKTIVTAFTPKKVRIKLETNLGHELCVEAYKLIKYEE